MKKQFQPRDTSNWPRELFELPNDPVLKARNPVHETAGVLRIHRASRLRGPLLTEALKISQEKLVQLFQKGLDDEEKAKRAKVAIYDSRMPRGAK